MGVNQNPLENTPAVDDFNVTTRSTHGPALSNALWFKQQSQ
ncbi:hypothetical protein [Candidatus Sororendozoicomonas aggregata]